MLRPEFFQVLSVHVLQAIAGLNWSLFYLLFRKRIGEGLVRISVFEREGSAALEGDPFLPPKVLWLE